MDFYIFDCKLFKRYSILTNFNRLHLRKYLLGLLLFKSLVL
ncbi:hypothetical protein BBUCA112A_D0030 (plasmid) [Borreliella burgdorferi CA-11.2A]|nr:hypothetical protein BBU72A_D0032 [Borreliella burgdorferi 72a]ACN56198.1 hypothetical protein BBUCA112A_D0030 [Borreliella burgdorferi CA-11.2A]